MESEESPTQPASLNMTKEECIQAIWGCIPPWLIKRIDKAIPRLSANLLAIAAQIQNIPVTAGELLSVLGKNEQEPQIRLNTILTYLHLLQLSFKSETDGKILVGYGSGNDLPVKINSWIILKSF